MSLSSTISFDSLESLQIPSIFRKVYLLLPIDLMTAYISSPDIPEASIEVLKRNRQIFPPGICNYAKYQLTSARIEGGNVSIGMIRKRARGIRDTEYFKLKIRQTSVPDNQSMFYIGG